MRSLLSNYLDESGEPVSINALVNTPLHSRDYFDDCLGLSSALMTYNEILRHRPGLHTLLAEEVESVSFSKTHETCQHFPDGMPLFSPQSFSGVIHIVRNPLDIAVSYAHHLQCDINRAIKIMSDPAAMYHDLRDNISPELPHLVSDWSTNVSSWLDQEALPMKVVSYEAMHANPHAVLTDVIAFCGLPQHREKLNQAIENSCFHRLQEQENQVGFNERQPTAPSFFRKGQVGDWKDSLTADQARLIVERHGAVMDRLGYL